MRGTPSVLALLLLIAVTTVVVTAAVTVVSRNRHFNEVDRFHRASRMTTEWSRAGVTKPIIAPLDEAPRRRPEGQNDTSSADLDA